MAHTAEDLVKLLKSATSPLALVSHFPEFGEEFGNLVGRLEKAERALAELDRRVTALEPAKKPAPKAGA